MEIITPIVVLSLISLILGILIVLADRFLADYGECKLIINDGAREYTVRGGSTILSYLSSNKIFIPSACGGKATCGLCKGRVLSDVGPVLPTERPFLDKEEFDNNTRLLCQVKVKKDTEILIPEEFFLVKEFRTTVEAITPLSHDTQMFRFKLEEPNEILFKPGQFVQFRIPKAGEERAYSIASSPNEKNIVELIVRLVPGGLCTTYMFNKLKVGDPIFLTGPYGDFYLREETDDPIICVAGGSGSAPIRSIINYLNEKKSERTIRSFYGGRTPKDIYLTEYYEGLAKILKDFKHIPAISEYTNVDEKSWTGERGLITEVIANHFEDLSEYEAYMCGPPIMIQKATELLIKLGINKDRVFFDEF
ncbi:MAG: 2Fe-2S iron-sulfur cluster binding domain-containing protein [Candidatus Latescibacteria bacterium]|nr:2Fe-2S iron-sulfur cluster binding domain-containing protein [Candidatus Latescibacterota bacterium]